MREKKRKLILTSVQGTHVESHRGRVGVYLRYNSKNREAERRAIGHCDIPTRVGYWEKKKNMGRASS